ncbi:unnamed protein product, partial [Closterium sp. NIES-54]
LVHAIQARQQCCRQPCSCCKAAGSRRASAESTWGGECRSSHSRRGSSGSNRCGGRCTWCGACWSWGTTWYSLTVRFSGVSTRAPSSPTPISLR